MLNLIGDIKPKIIIALSFFCIYLLIYSNNLQSQVQVEQRKKQELAANIEFQNRSIAEWKKQGDELKLRLASAEKKAKTYQLASERRENRYAKVANHSCEDAAIWAASVAPELLKAY